MGNQHTYGRDEWQTEQLRGMTPEQLTVEHGATTVAEYRGKVETELKRRRLPVPDAPKRKAKAKSKR